MKILLAVDGSPHTKKMLAYLATHMETFGSDSTFTALTVEPPLPPRARAIVGADMVVASGLASGERIVAAGVGALREGMAVRPLESR